ncbi:MAG: elongation factor G [Peptoniphilaceae bacterium]|nr:elongation factor G [Peptoniphilaceae bacterium]MDD7383183.1 elongation factor G [Peptoniphilaceae bacterium]MDY3738407.1 elongation factor G [Peptoniphilaceae bacterium]
MKKYETKNIRNLALVGHSGSGKTSITESILFKTSVIDRVGKVTSGNTVSDYSQEEKKRKVSISTSVIPVEYDDKKINLIDSPGVFDFEAEVLNSLRASEAGLLVIDASAGIEVGSEKYRDYMERIGLPRIIFVNKMDLENVDFNKVVSDLHLQFGKKVVPLTLTLGSGNEFEGLIDLIDKKAFKYNGYEREEVEIPENRIAECDAAYEEIVEVVAQTDDALMEKFFNGEEFSEEEFRKGITSAMLTGDVVPLIAGSAELGFGIDLLLECIAKYMPSPDDSRANIGFRPVNPDNTRKVDVNEPFSAYIFKTISDPFVGKISIFKVVSGKINESDEVYNVNQSKSEKAGGLFYIRGKEQIKTKEVVAGDIAAFSKLSLSHTSDTLADKNHPVEYKKVNLPKPVLFYAIEAESKADEDKISSSLSKLHEEDPTFTDKRNPETNQEILGGIGNVQLDVILSKLKNIYGVSAKVVDYKIPYREAIKGKSEVQGRYKKQTGGAGQYGDVWIRFEPSDEDFVFDEEVFGGSVPKNYFPAVEKGLLESMKSGPLAGYKVIGVKATLYDGSYHPVDSNEQAFKTAAQLAFKKGITEANPILLEPVMKMNVIIPDSYMGDVIGDLNKRRGKILGMNPKEGSKQEIKVLVPLAEVLEYAIDLRSMTQARGSFDMEFEKYEEVPKEEMTRIINEMK